MAWRFVMDLVNSLSRNYKDTRNAFRKVQKFISLFMSFLYKKLMYFEFCAQKPNLFAESPAGVYASFI